MVGGRAVVEGDTYIHHNANVGGSAHITSATVGYMAEVLTRDHVVTFGPIGPERVQATLVRTRGGDHSLKVGCETCTLDTLMSVVAERSERWRGDELMKRHWIAQYEAFKSLGDVCANRWLEEARGL